MEGAERSGTVALAMSTDQPREQLRTALNLARCGDYAGARRELEDLLRLAPEFADGHYYLGLVCNRSGDPSAARVAFERCLEIDPFYHEAREQLRGMAFPEPEPVVELPSPSSEGELAPPAMDEVTSLPMEEPIPPQEMVTEPQPSGDIQIPSPPSQDMPGEPYRTSLLPDMDLPRIEPLEPLHPEPRRNMPPPVPPVLPPIEECSPEQENWSPIYVKPGGFWIRGMALLIDVVLTRLAITPFLPLLILPFRSVLADFEDIGQQELLGSLFEKAMLGDNTPLLMWSLCGLLLITAEMTFDTFVFGYYYYVSGQTPGKRLMGVRVVDASSLDYLTVGQAIWRYAASTLNGCLCGVTYLVAVFNPERRAIHDFLASTRVVYSERVPMETTEKAITAALILFAAFGLLFTLF